MTREGTDSGHIKQTCTEQPMNYYARIYQTGEEIQPGDHILWAGKPGTVLFVLGLPGVPADGTWFETTYAEGFMVEVEGVGQVFHEESNEDLEFLARKT